MILNILIKTLES